MILIHKVPKGNENHGMEQYKGTIPKIILFKNIQKQIETHARCQLLTLTSLRGLRLACVQSI